MNVLDLDVVDLRHRAFRFDALSDGDGRIEWWELPDPNGVYSIGADAAYGIAGRDYDAVCVLRVGRQPTMQVAEAHGHWGPRLDRVLYALGMMYNEALIVAERQVGLFALQSLYHTLGYRNLYGDRDESRPGRTAQKRLGYHRGADDVTLPKLRKAVIEQSLIIRSTATLDQMSQLQFRPRNSVPVEEALDADLKIRLATGGSPDLVMAAAYAWHGVGECQWVEPPPPRYQPNTAGDILGHAVLDGPEESEVVGPDTPARRHKLPR